MAHVSMSSVPVKMFAHVASPTKSITLEGEMSVEPTTFEQAKAYMFRDVTLRVHEVCYDVVNNQWVIFFKAWGGSTRKSAKHMIDTLVETGLWQVKEEKHESR